VNYKTIKERWDRYSTEQKEDKENQILIQELLARIFGKIFGIGGTEITDANEYDQHVARMRHVARFSTNKDLGEEVEKLAKQFDQTEDKDARDSILNELFKIFTKVREDKRITAEEKIKEIENFKNLFYNEGTNGKKIEKEHSDFGNKYNKLIKDLKREKKREKRREGRKKKKKKKRKKGN